MSNAMNLAEAKNLVSSLQYLSSVTEGTYLNVIDGDMPEAQRLEIAGKELLHACEVFEQIIKRLDLVSPDFLDIRNEVDREALLRGRQFMEERSEKISLLRLAGDDTPEEMIP